MQRAASGVLYFIIFLAGLYAAVGVTMYAVQRKLQYFPSAVEATPERVGLSGAETVHISTPDGERLLAWFLRAAPGRSTILYFHGNGGGISNRAEKINFFAAHGFGVLALSYRGYEGSTGSPSEAGLVTDGLAAHDWLTSRGVLPDDIDLLGESLGSGIAVQVAEQRKVGAIVLEAPFASAVDIGAKAYWYLPVRLLMKDQYKSIDHIKQVGAPLLILHGTADTLIPVTEGRRLFAAASEPKAMQELEGLGHEIVHDPSLWPIVAKFFLRPKP